MNNLQMFQGSNEPLRDVSFAPNDVRFVTGGDDKLIKIWDFEGMREERQLSGELRTWPIGRRADEERVDSQDIYGMSNVSNGIRPRDCWSRAARII